MRLLSIAAAGLLALASPSAAAQPPILPTPRPAPAAPPTSTSPAPAPASPAPVYPSTPVPAQPAPAPVSPSTPVSAQPGPAPVSPPIPAPPAPATSAPSDPTTVSTPAPEPAPDTEPTAGEVVLIEGEARVAPGSAHIIRAEDLARFARDDVHHVLAEVPGVYLREEDGYGLRPNIGMRGAGSERSSKIALMEDGVLIAPAPYSAPAAYYFPLVSRMQAIEVLKGPASIRHGPNTVGGAINLVSQPIPSERTAEVDAALGGDGYGKLHALYGERWRRAGFVLEGAGLRSSGFKDLDGGGDTGFERKDLLAKGRWNTDPDRTFYQEVELKVGYADETSHETYLGLTDEDLRATPYRRYAGSQLDRMKWDHWHLQASHRLLGAGPIDLTTTVYHLRLDRTWKKLNGFDSERSLNEILANPDSGNNAVFYQVLTGQADSASESETLLLGENARDFAATGAQLVATSRGHLFAFDHELEAGLRLHTDRATRLHTEESYLMMSGALVRDERPEGTTRDETGSAMALSFHVQDRARLGPLTVTAGLRTEVIASELDDRLRADGTADENYTVLIPGGGVFYELGPWLGLLAGVHKGFVPVQPGQGERANPEESINYEAGARAAYGPLNAELIGFFNDYSNLGGVCTLAIGCPDGQVDTEFDGGRVHVYGLEAAARAEPAFGVLSFPMSAAYTHTRSEFRTSFSSDNPQWGDVRAGFELPYLPRHQLAVSGAVRMRHFEVAASARHTSAMRDAAGIGALDRATSTEAATVIDLGGHVYLGPWGQAYLTVQNVADEAHVAARRPFGARPGMPRLVILGYKNSF